MRVRADEERSTESLTIRMKPSIKNSLKALAEEKGIGMAEVIELMILEKKHKATLIHFMD